MTMQYDNLLNTIVAAGWNVNNAKQEAVAAIKQAGGAEQKFVRESFVVGWMACKLFNNAKFDGAITVKMENAALSILNKKGKDAKTLKTGEKRRTDAEELLYHNARHAWRGVLFIAQVKSADKRGGANNKAGSNGKDKQPETVATFEQHRAYMLEHCSLLTLQDDRIALTQLLAKMETQYKATIAK